MKRVIKKNYKFILGIVIGLIWSGGIAYAATILFDSDEVSYDNTTSGLSATNVQSALDELYVESTSYQLFESRLSELEEYKTTWKTVRNLSTMNVGATQTLPTGWNELLVYVSQSSNSDIYYSFHVYRIFASHEFMQGYGAYNWVNYVVFGINNDLTVLTLKDTCVASNSCSGYNPKVAIYYR